MGEIRVAEAAEMEAWDAYLAAHPDSSVFQSSTWRKVVESSYGHRAYYLMALTDSHIRGVLPLFLIESRIFGRVLASSPYATVGGVTADDGEAACALVARAVELARENQVDYLEVKNRTAMGCAGLHLSTDYANFCVPLADPETMWNKQLKQRARTAVRKAESYQLTFSRGQDLLEPFYRIMAVNMRRLGTPLHSRVFYHNIVSFFGADADLLGASYRGHPIAVLLTLRFKKLVTALYGSSLPAFRHMNANHYLFWQTIKRTAEAGNTVFELGRSVASSSAETFKKSWGAESSPLCYEYYLNRRSAVPRIHQGNSHFRLARWGWRFLPLPVTKWLGPLLIRSIP